MLASRFLAKTLKISSSSSMRLHRSFSVQVSASHVKQLRETSGAPMMDCKKALIANDGDIEAAMDWLRAKGIARATTNADRKAEEGLVAILTLKNGNATLVEVNSETDFVGKNADFHKFVNLVASTASTAEPTTVIKHSNGTTIANINPDTFLHANDGAMQNSLGLVIATIRENIVIKRIMNLSPGPDNVFANYVHGKIISDEDNNNYALTMGKTVGLICLNAPGVSDTNRVAVEDIGKKLAMHVVAAKPIFCTIDDVDDDFLVRERAIMDEQMASDEKNAKKPQDILVKIREGKIQKRLSEVCLANQLHMVEDNAPVVSKFLAQAGKKLDLSGDLNVVTFQRWGLGESK